MARKPAPLQFKGGKGPRQRVWELIRAQRGARFELREVTPDDVSPATARTYVQSLAAAAIITPRGARGAALMPHCLIKGWTLAQDLGIEAPRVRRDGTPVTQGMAQEQMWRALRMLTIDINARELAAYASTPSVVVSLAAAGDYLRNLHHAGYLTSVVPKAPVGKPLHRYHLLAGHNSGPRAPMVCRTDVLYDPNTDLTLPIHRVSDEDFIYGK